MALGALYTYGFQGKLRSSLLCRIKIYQKESELQSQLSAARALPSLIPSPLHALQRRHVRVTEGRN